MQTLTPRIVGELLAHEGLVPEAYRDSVGVWTWSVGVTNASGHRVHPRYLDNPQPLDHCLAVFVWLLERVYLSPVLKAFGARKPAEHELAAALLFHYNTGAIARCEWLRCFLSDDADAARASLLNWRRPAGIVPRRRRERDLFFDARWSGDGRVLLYDVAKPSYRPVNPRRVDVAPVLARLLTDEGPWTAAEVPPLDSGPCGPSPALSSRRSWFDRLFD